MTNTEKQILTMAVNDAAARKAYREAKKAKPRKAAHQDELPQIEIRL